MPDWGDSMEVIIHLPRSKEGQEELAKRVATVHALLHLDGFFDKVSATEDDFQLAARINLNAFYHLTDDGVIVLHAFAFSF